MFQRTRHFAPTFRAWDPADARRAITEIATDAMSHVNATTLWPSHPMDEGVRDGHGSVYFGAAGVVWALDYLSRVHAITDELDLAPLVTKALERNAPWFATTAYARHASLLMGELGILMVQMRVAPDQGLANEIYTLLALNSELPIVELMWGLPGCMLACIHMHTMTKTTGSSNCFNCRLHVCWTTWRWTTTVQSGRRIYMGVSSDGSDRCTASLATCCRCFMAGIGWIPNNA